jgi:hypothetical protein
MRLLFSRPTGSRVDPSDSDSLWLGYRAGPSQIIFGMSRFPYKSLKPSATQNAQENSCLSRRTGYDHHNAAEMQNMNARHTPASDWVDYALDQQTVTGTGGVAVKVSSAYTETWANGQGQYYQTNDQNANPNGSLPGNWTRQTEVHGNGQAR